MAILCSQVLHLDVDTLGTWALSIGGVAVRALCCCVVWER